MDQRRSGAWMGKSWLRGCIGGRGPCTGSARRLVFLVFPISYPHTYHLPFASAYVRMIILYLVLYAGSCE